MAPTTAHEPQSPSAMDLSACTQYALYTWAATTSADPKSIDAQTDRAYEVWANPNGGSPDSWEMRFEQAVCFVQRGKAAAALAVLTQLADHANIQDGKRDMQNYAWPMTHIEENEVWRWLGLAQAALGDVANARRDLRIAYFDYPRESGRASIAHDLQRIDPRALPQPPAYTADETNLMNERGTPCLMQNFRTREGSGQAWWYCDASGNYIEAYTFRNGQKFSYYTP